MSDIVRLCAPPVKPDRIPLTLFDSIGTHYVAAIGLDAIDDAGPLAPFLSALMGTFSELDSDVVVWEMSGEKVVRAVCLVRPGVEGPYVVWF